MDALLCHSSPFFLRQGLSLNLVTGQQPASLSEPPASSPPLDPEVASVHTTFTGLFVVCFYVSPGYLNSGLCACTVISPGLRLVKATNQLICLDSSQNEILLIDK